MEAEGGGGEEGHGHAQVGQLEQRVLGGLPVVTRPQVVPHGLLPARISSSSSSVSKRGRSVGPRRAVAVRSAAASAAGVVAVAAAAAVAEAGAWEQRVVVAAEQFPQRRGGDDGGGSGHGGCSGNQEGGIGHGGAMTDEDVRS